MKNKNALFQQSLALMSVFVNSFMYGAASSWASNAIIFLTSPGHTPSATVEQCSLIAQFLEAGRLIFAIPGGILVDKFGRKKILISAGYLNFISWTILYFANSIILIYTARLFLGVSVALLYVSAFSMIGELASPSHRGTLTCVNEVATMSGQLFESVVTVLANTYSALNISTAVLSSFFFPTIAFLIESPYYLVQKVRPEKAKFNLRIVRPGYSEFEVNEEFEQLVECIEEEKRQKKRVSWINLYRVKTFRKSLQCALLLNVVAVSCGGPIMALYAAVMLPSNEYFPNYFYPFISFSVQFIAAFLSTFYMDKFPRRHLYLFASICSIAMQSLNAIAYALYDPHNQNGGQFWKWCFIINNFAYMLIDRGFISPLNCTVRTEILPQIIKGVGNALCVICQAASLILSYRIYDIVNAKFGLVFNYVIFAIDSIVLTVVVYFMLPEMKGKSLAEVQNDLKQNTEENEGLLSNGNKSTYSNEN